MPRVVTYNRVDCIMWLALAAGKMGQAEQKYTLTLTSSELHWYPFRLYHLFLLLQLIQESFLQFNFLLLQKSEGNNCSIVKPWHKFSRAKLIVRSVVKWRKFQPKKKLQQLWSASTTRLTQSSKPVKNRKKTCFLIYSSRFLDRFEQLSAEATFCTKAHTAKM